MPFADPLVPDETGDLPADFDGRSDGRPWTADIRMVAGLGLPLDEISATRASLFLWKRKQLGKRAHSRKAAPSQSPKTPTPPGHAQNGRFRAKISENVRGQAARR